MSGELKKNTEEEERYVADGDLDAIQIITETGFKDIQQSFRVLTNAVKDTKVNSVVEQSMKQQEARLDKFVEAIKEIKTDDELMNTVSSMSKEIREGQKEINQNLKTLIEEQKKLREWKFSLERGYGNFTESITAKQLK